MPETHVVMGVIYLMTIVCGLLGYCRGRFDERQRCADIAEEMANHRASAIAVKIREGRP